MGYMRRLLGRTRTLDSHASRLRRKLNTNGECAYVLNVGVLATGLSLRVELGRPRIQPDA